MDGRMCEGDKCWGGGCWKACTVGSEAMAALQWLQGRLKAQFSLVVFLVIFVAYGPVNRNECSDNRLKQKYTKRRFLERPKLTRNEPLTLSQQNHPAKQHRPLTPAAPYVLSLQTQSHQAVRLPSLQAMPPHTLLYSPSRFTSSPLRRCLRCRLPPRRPGWLPGCPPGWAALSGPASGCGSEWASP